VLNQAGADFGALLTDLLAPYAADREIELKGPKFLLTQSSAVAFSLAAHELATNANKYGSLSRDNGKLGVGWRVDTSGERPYFEMIWTESGGPVVPSRTPAAGFGRNTIEQSLAQTIDGTVTLDFAPTGLVCTIRAPLSERLGITPN
jgi:two-component sensor histidine kinase